MPRAHSCAYHPHLPITNFCRSAACMLPLCPKCVKVHCGEHSRMGTHGDLDNIEDLHEEISEQLQNTLKTLL